MRTADVIRMRVLNSNETVREFEKLPRKERLTRRPLRWRKRGTRFEPLRVAFWPDTSRLVQAAWLRAMAHMEEDVGYTLFEIIGIDAPNIQVGLGEYEAELIEDWSDFTLPTPGFLFGGGERAIMGPDTEQEFGFCEMTWNEKAIIQSANAAVDTTLDFPDMWKIAAHELGHVLCLGHDPDTPMRLMYRSYGGVGRLKPLECQWVCTIHGLLWVPKRKRTNA